MSIYYSKSNHGYEVASWSGKSIRKGGRVTKEKQIYLGKVIDKEKLIFYKRKEGYYHFVPETQAMISIADADVPPNVPPPDRRLKERNVIVSFGGSYFLDQLIGSIEYKNVLNEISVKNPDTMYGLLHYYLLSNHPDCDAHIWYQNSYARFLYPQANLSSQRISDFYVRFGNDNNRQAFFTKHIDYLKSTTNDEYAILLDTTGCQNACGVPIAKVCRNNYEINAEYRVALVIQRSTGLPVYYEIYSGNGPDSTTIDRIIKLMGLYGFKVSHVSGDAGYRCPANIETVILYSSDLIMRLTPAYDIYKKAALENEEAFTQAGYQPENDIMYRNRVVRVIKVPTVVGTDCEGNEVEGYVYLCRDKQAYPSKADPDIGHHEKETDSAQDFLDVCKKFGLFAIVSTKDLAKRDVIPVYYMRQGVDSFFDFAKNYGNMMPLLNHNIHTVQGHMLMSFIVTFLVIMIKNRMNTMDIPYLLIPAKRKAEEGECATSSDSVEDMEIEQETNLNVFKSNPAELFSALNLVGADVFENREDGDNQIVPGLIRKEEWDFYRAFGIPYPLGIMIQSNHTLQPVFAINDKNTCKKAKVFAARPFVSQDEAEDELKKKAEKKKTKKKEDTEPEDASEEEKPKRGPGRPPGSKNKKTLEREAKMAEEGVQAEEIKHPRGRPLGSKDKKPRKRRTKKEIENDKKNA